MKHIQNPVFTIFNDHIMYRGNMILMSDSKNTLYNDNCEYSEKKIVTLD